MTYWNVALLLVCLAVCTVGVYGGRKHRHHGHSLSCGNIFSPTNNAAAAQYGVKIPPKKCLLTWEQFEDHVIGKDWLGTYVIDTDDDPLVAHKAKLHWELLPNDNIRRLASLRSDQGEKECIIADAEFARACPKLAKFRPVGEGAEFITEARVDRFISCDPTKYVIFCICYVEEVNGRCPSTECFVLFKDQRPKTANFGREGDDILLDNIPWTLIESTLKRCIDHVFNDDQPPRLQYVWHMEECPHPKAEE